MPDDLIYEEKISSARTEVLFVALTFLFFALFYRRLMVTGPGVIAGIFLLLSLLFAFYALNYRFLIIRDAIVVDLTITSYFRIGFDGDKPLEHTR